MSTSVKQTAEVIYFAHFNMAEDVIISKKQETVLPWFSDRKVDCILYMLMHP